MYLVKKFLDTCKKMLTNIKLFFVAVWRTVNKGSSKIVNPDVKPGVRRVGRMFGSVTGIIVRITLIVLLTGILTGAILGVFGAIYVTRYLDVNTDLPLDQMQLDLTTHIWAENPYDHEGWIPLATLSGRENRVWVPFEEIPDFIINATVAIEDKRFWDHDGVDWKRTIGAFYTMFSPGDGPMFGGSTLTQQLIKNITKDSDATVSRKIQEIFRALAFERDNPGRGGKEYILEMYLNTVYFGSGCYGVVTAAQRYFGKELDDLTVAEAASLIGITNNPSVFNPYTNPKNNKRRQEVILSEMFDQRMLTRHEFNIAKYAPLNFHVGTAGGGDSIRSWFVDQIIRDATEDLMRDRGWSRAVAQQWIFSGGLNIYATIDLNIQKAMDDIWLDDDRWPDSPDAEPAEAAMTIVCNETGNIKAMIGGREKTGNLEFDRSTHARRQPGSAIKPITVYAPAFDLGLLHPYSPVDDIPQRDLNDRAWPRNLPDRYEGFTNVMHAMAVSKNTVATHVLDFVGVQRSADYARDRFGITTLIESGVDNDMSIAPLALGGLTHGVTVREMTEAFASIANGGVRNRTRTYTHITSQDGTMFYENRRNPTLAIKEMAAYYTELTLIAAVQPGATGRHARLENMPIAGKTGTTSRNVDRWFAGYTPYYTAVTWFGYDIPRDMSYYSSNPAVHMWRQVMEKAHEGLERKEFAQPGGVGSYRHCIDSGMPVGAHCHLDPRGGSRTATGFLSIDDMPSGTCTMHVSVDLCTVSGRLATAYCPSDTRRRTALINITRYVPRQSFSLGDEQYTIRHWQGGVSAPTLPSARPFGERFRAVAVGNDGRTPFNSFCTLHTTPQQQPPPPPPGPTDDPVPPGPTDATEPPDPPEPGGSGDDGGD
jgi:penicillin-binding protein 1A